MVDIALLCTQTSPVVRPAMSRVVSMLVGDIEVCSATTRPGYLTDWKYTGESTSSLSMEAERNGPHNTPPSSSTKGYLSTENAGQPFLSEILGEGR